MEKQKLIIVGAGGHARVVAECALLQDKYHLVGFADDNLKPGTEIIPGFSVISTAGNPEAGKTNAGVFVVAVGDNEIRKKLFTLWSGIAQATTIIHPSAIVSDSVQLGSGNVVLPGAVINSGSETGSNVIVNSRVLIDHDCRVGSHVHIAQGCILGSNVQVDDLVKVEIGKVIPSFTQLKL